MANPKSNVALILTAEEHPRPIAGGTQARVEVPEPPPAAFIGWVTMKENDDKPSSSLSVYIRLPGTPLTYRQAYVPTGVTRLGGLPECTDCHRNANQFRGSLFVSALAEAGKLSPEDERLCEDCYRRRVSS